MSSVFFSYSHKDEALRDRLEVHLAALRREGAISTWHDRCIKAGGDFAGQIDAYLEQAGIILLLVSPDFLASDYCHEVEMRRALERDATGDARVIPVILRPCDWKHSPFSHLLAIPTDGNPITRWPDEDEAFLDVVTQIRSALPAPGRVSQTRPQQPVRATEVQSPGPRSSNLRLRKDFTDADKDSFLDEAFEYMERFFENSLAELSKRNDGVEGRFRKIDANHFTAVVYQNGGIRAQCTVTLGGLFGRGIGYSNQVGGSSNSWNETLSIEHDDQHLFLKLAGLSLMGSDREQKTELPGCSRTLLVNAHCVAAAGLASVAECCTPEHVGFEPN